MGNVTDGESYVECPVCGAKMSYSEKLYVIPFYTLDETAKSFSVTAKGVCWECFRGRVMHGDDYRPAGRARREAERDTRMGDGQKEGGAK